MSSKCAIVVPSLNRPEWIERQRRYYGYYNGYWPLYIEEGGLSYMHAVYGALKRVKEPYVVFSGDDDFHLPNGIEECVSFLDDNPSYIACYGDSIQILFDGFPKAIASVFKSGRRFFAVHDTFIFQKCVEAALPLANLDNSSDRTAMNAQEEMFVHASNWYGKCGSIPRLQMIRGLHEGQGYDTPKAFPWPKWTSWATSYLPSHDGSLYALGRRSSPFYVDMREFWRAIK